MVVSAEDREHRYEKYEGHVQHVPCVGYVHGKGEQAAPKIVKRICGG